MLQILSFHPVTRFGWGLGCYNQVLVGSSLYADIKYLALVPRLFTKPNPAARTTSWKQNDSFVSSLFSCDTHGKRSLLKLISTMSFLSDTHIHITYLQWLLELKCKWYDEMFKWTTGTYGHFDLLHFGLLNYHRFLYCRLLPCITRRVNTCKSLLLRIHELPSWTSCIKTADNGSVTEIK